MKAVGDMDRRGGGRGSREEPGARANTHASDAEDAGVGGCAEDAGGGGCAEDAGGGGCAEDASGGGGGGGDAKDAGGGGSAKKTQPVAVMVVVV